MEVKKITNHEQLIKQLQANSKKEIELFINRVVKIAQKSNKK